MIPTMQQTLYLAFGLKLRSEVALPELLPAERPKSLPDIEINYGDLSQDWESSRPHPSCFAVLSPRQVLFAVPGTAIYEIKDGRQIVVSPLHNADEGLIRLYLLGTCIGILLMQRGLLPLHGSAVVIDGGAYAFVGESGAGKSTLAAAFAKRGFTLLSDDVIAVSLQQTQDGQLVPTITPSYPQQKLWQDSLEQLGMGDDGYAPLHHELAKFAVPMSASYCRQPIPLRGIFELLPTEDGDVIELSKLSPLECLPLIGQHTYRNFLIHRLGLQEWHFSYSAAIAGRTGIYRLRRPASPFSAYDLTDRIIQTIREGA